VAHCSLAPQTALELCVCSGFVCVCVEIEIININNHGTVAQGLTAVNTVEKLDYYM
jgi:hypothetical protein